MEGSENWNSWSTVSKIERAEMLLPVALRYLKNLHLCVVFIRVHWMVTGPSCGKKRETTCPLEGIDSHFATLKVAPIFGVGNGVCEKG